MKKKRWKIFFSISSNKLLVKTNEIICIFMNEKEKVRKDVFYSKNMKVFKFGIQKTKKK